APGAALAIELVEPPSGLRVRGGDLEQLLIRFRRVLNVRELLEPAATRRAEELLLLLEIGRDLGELELVRDEIAMPAESLVQADDFTQLLDVLALAALVELQDLPEHGEERGVVLLILPVDGGELAQDLEPRRLVLERCSLELNAQQIDQRVVALSLLVQRLQALARFEVVRVLPEDVLVLLDRLLGVRLAL